MTNIEARKITLHEMSLRDGMHPLRHQMSLEQMVAVARAARGAGIPWIEVIPRRRAGRSRLHHGFAAHGGVDYLRAVVPQMKQARISALLLPGIGTVDTLKEAMDCGISGKCVAAAVHRGRLRRTAHRLCRRVRAGYGGLSDDGASAPARQSWSNRPC
ncbi:hypothetical protein PE067_16765 [Paracoccus sp. DMF-8]|uniref:hypothetical protein n=1 Tax=Paracoccus sp. DMF-8 TaxID=3019445 RepID=UPI0023E36B7A|nr:hypothetical protein [Paracoccus sp. DMF-8]MDF3607647.1 hypothetical protein [Paracoccus sp. DMF-8]